MANLNLRMKMYKFGIKHYELAKEIGIYPTTLSVWMREELEGDRLERVEKAIEKLKSEQKAGASV